MLPPSAPMPRERIVDREVDHLLRELLFQRRVLAPVMVLFILAMLWLDNEPWRIAVLGILLVVGGGGAIWSARRVRHRDRADSREVAISFGATIPLQLAGITATGGLDSPLIVALPPFMVLSTVLLGRTRWLAALLAFVGVWVVGLTVLQPTGFMDGLALSAFGQISPTHRVAAGLVLTLAVLVASGIGLVLRSGLEAMVARMWALRDEQLEALLDQAHDLEVAGGELAHELKNPLATIHGLSTLLQRELTSDKGLERMEVMRGEVARMTEILEEFLTYSRPLTPLTVVDVDGVALAEQVLALHEGMAEEQGLRLVLEAPDAVMIRGDVRKLQQALVNLVQNAMHASDTESVIDLAVMRVAGGIVFEVRDRGPGLPQGMEEQVFHAGVTTRSGGSGLGLTVARTLIRQHEGELRLLPRRGGGLIARVELP